MKKWLQGFAVAYMYFLWIWTQYLALVSKLLTSETFTSVMCSFIATPTLTFFNYSEEF